MDNKQLIAGELAKVIDSLDQDAILNLLRSEERRVGKECAI